MMGYLSLLLWVAILSVAVGLYDITLVKVSCQALKSLHCCACFIAVPSWEFGCSVIGGE